MPSRIDNVVGNPHVTGDNIPGEDYQKTIHWILDDQTIITGRIAKKKDQTDLVFTGTFKVTSGVKEAKDLTETDKQELKKDFNDEKSALMAIYPRALSFVLPPTESTTPESCENDADGDKVTNSGDNCPNVFNPDQADSNNDGVGDACESVQICDVDLNGAIDVRDISYITAARNLPAIPRDRRDPDGDGIITVNDARICTLRCTKLRCAQ